MAIMQGNNGNGVRKIQTAVHPRIFGLTHVFGLFWDRVKRGAHSVETPLKDGSRGEIRAAPLSSLVPVPLGTPTEDLPPRPMF